MCKTIPPFTQLKASTSGRPCLEKQTEFAKATAHFPLYDPQLKAAPSPLSLEACQQHKMQKKSFFQCYIGKERV